MRLVFVCIFSLLLLNACIKPYACECETVQTKQKSHIVIYASKKNSKEACAKNGMDTSIVCTVLY